MLSVLKWQKKANVIIIVDFNPPIFINACHKQKNLMSFTGPFIQYAEYIFLSLAYGMCCRIDSGYVMKYVLTTFKK